MWFKTLFQDREIAVMCLLLGVILVLTLFRRPLLRLLDTPVLVMTSESNTSVATEAFTDSVSVPQSVKNFIRLASFTRDGQTGMMNTLHLDTRKVVNPDTDMLAPSSVLTQLRKTSSANNQSTNENTNRAATATAPIFVPPTNTELAGATVATAKETTKSTPEPSTATSDVVSAVANAKAKAELAAQKAAEEKAAKEAAERAAKEAALAEAKAEAERKAAEAKRKEAEEKARMEVERLAKVKAEEEAKRAREEEKRKAAEEEAARLATLKAKKLAEEKKADEEAAAKAAAQAAVVQAVAEQAASASGNESIPVSNRDKWYKECADVYEPGSDDMKECRRRARKRDKCYIKCRDDFPMVHQGDFYSIQGAGSISSGEDSMLNVLYNKCEANKKIAEEQQVSYDNKECRRQARKLNKCYNKCDIENPIVLKDGQESFQDANNATEIAEAVQALSDKERALLTDVGARKQGQAHMTDYYLDADAGLDMTLDMKFNAVDVPGNSATLPATLVIQEVGTGKTYRMENPQVSYNRMRPNALMLVSSRRSPEKEWDGVKYSVVQKFQVQLYFASPVSELLTGEGATDSFRRLINENLSLSQSRLTYTVYVPEVLGMDQPLYSVQYYLRRGEVNRQPVSQVAFEEFRKVTDEVLQERVPGIITPMYILDHEIGQMERTIGAISDEYRARQLAERQRQLQFYDTYN